MTNPVSEANHDLIRLLDKPGVIEYCLLYKEISFFEQREVSAFLENALISGRTGPMIASLYDGQSVSVPIF